MDKFSPGCCINVYKDGKEVFHYQAGYNDLENKVKLTGNELFNMYSCSKVAAAVTGMQMLEKGAFLLDEPLCEFIPEFKDITVKDADGNITKAKNYIKIRHLFTMTAGFNYLINDSLVNKATELGGGKVTTLSFAKALAYQPLNFEAGTRWQYSLCHDVLGAVVEVVTGKRLCDYMKENIFEPLGMNNTSFHIPAGNYHRLRSNTVTKYPVKRILCVYR